MTDNDRHGMVFPTLHRINELEAEVERLRKREAELWERESLAMRQRDAAEAKVSAIEDEARSWNNAYQDDRVPVQGLASRIIALATEATPTIEPNDESWLDSGDNE